MEWSNKHSVKILQHLLRDVYVRMAILRTGAIGLNIYLVINSEAT